MLNKVEFTEGSAVYTADGKQVGKVKRFVLDQVTNKITHIVVQRGWLLHADKVVALELIGSIRNDKVILSMNVTDFTELPSLEEKDFGTTPEDMELDDFAEDESLGSYWYTPHISHSSLDFAPEHHKSPVERRRSMPEETIPLKDGAEVISSDGKHIGHIERLLIEAGLNRASDFVIKYGLLFKHRKIIPAAWVKSVEEGKVYLRVSSQELEQLPSYEE